MEYKYKVVVDAFGGDNSPDEIVKGAVIAVNKIDGLKVILTGKEKEIQNLLEKEQYNKESIEIVNANDVISNCESPTVAIKQKVDSSLVVAFDILRKSEDVCGLVSAGSTGAVLTGGFLKLGRMAGVSRPALAPLLPTLKGTNVLLIDCGANMDARPINLCHFALMGSKFMETLGVKNPRVALLNVGVEDEKGNALCKKVFPVLKTLPINFVGNMEARDFLSGDYDVVVTDAFAGNVLLKSSEGAVLMILKMLKKEIKSSIKASIGAKLFLGKTFKNLKNTFDYGSHGGSLFLGTKKIVVKSHGSSKAESIYHSIQQVIEAHNAKLIEKMQDAVQGVNIEIEED